jgi:hypothetical protein
VKCQLGTGQKFRATFCSQIQTVFLASSRRPPKIKSRDFLKLLPLPPLRNKNPNFQWFQQIADPLILLHLCAVIYGRSPKNIRSSSPISDFFSQQNDRVTRFFFSFFFQNLIRVHSNCREKKITTTKRKETSFFFEILAEGDAGILNFFRLCFLLENLIN